MGNTVAQHTGSSLAVVSVGAAATPGRASLRQAETQRNQRLQDARNVLEGFRIREALRLQEVDAMKQSQEEQLVITQREFFQGLEAQRLHEAQQLREAQQVYNAQLLDHTAKVNQARLTQEAAHRRKRDAFDAFEQAQSPAKRARIQDDSVVATTAELEPELVPEAEAVVPVVDAAEAVVVSVVEAPEAVLVVVDVTEAELKRADLAAAEAIAYVYKVRRDIFLQEREARNSQLALNHRQLALNHEGRMRAECERVERGVIVAPVEYVLLEVNRAGEAARYWRVLLGECNLTFSYLDYSCYGEQRGLTRKQWEDRYRKTAPLWNFWNPLKEGGHILPQIDPDFQDDVFILPHFREEIATHLESQSMIHTAIQSIFALCPNAHAPYKLDPSFEVTLKFLARMKKFNRLEFATISCAL